MTDSRVEIDAAAAATADAEDDDRIDRELVAAARDGDERALDLLLRHLVGYFVILLLAHVVGVLEAFVVYRRTVFQVRGHVLRDLARFESVYLVALGVNATLLPLLVEVVGLPVIASQVLIVAVTALVSFFGHKHFSFRRPRAGG